MPATQAYPGPGFLLSLGDGSGTPGRTFSDGATTNASPNLTSAAQAAFVSGDVGRTVSGPGIPTGTTILTYTSATAVVLTANATATATGVTITLGPILDVFTVIPGIQDMKVLPLSTDIHDITNQSSPGFYEEVVATINRSGETSFPMVFNPGNPTHDDLTGLQYLRNNRIRRNYKFALTTPILASSYAKALYFAAFVTGFDMSAPVNGVLMADTKLKVTGQPIWQ